MKELRQYQSSIIQAVRDAYAQGFRKILIQLPTGGGKSVIFSKIIGSADEKGSETLFLVHRRELVKQASQHMTNEGVDHGIIMAGQVPDMSHHTQMASIQTLWARAVKKARINLPKSDLVVVDECFPAETLVDGVPIKDITVGDYVSAFNERAGKIEQKKVVRVFKNTAPTYMVSILIGRHMIHCTKGHPIFTNKGWVNAENITTDHKLRVVQDGNPPTNRLSDKETREYWTSLLLKKMLRSLSLKSVIRNNDENEQKICVREDEKKQPNEKSRITSKNVGNITKDWPQTTDSGRERATTNKCRGSAFRFVRISWIRASNYCENWALQGRKRVSVMLQNRLRPLGFNAGDRGRRDKPSYARKERSGLKEGQILSWLGVDDIAIRERSNIKNSRACCEDGYVYNIEVEGLHTYTADGIVVHNCHHVGSKTYDHLFEFYDESFILGVTATPTRKNGKGLGNYFDCLILAVDHGASVRQLMDAGFLAEASYMVPDIPDLAGIPSRGGDWVEEQLGVVMNDAKLIGNIVEHYREHALNRKMLCFATGVAHSRAITNMFNAAGISAAHVDGKTHIDERDQIFADFAAGKYKILSNCEVITEGNDIPDVDGVIYARPTKSLRLYLQMGGRGLRPKSDGGDCLIMDHTGNYFRHGPLDEEHDWSLNENENISERDAKKKDDVERKEAKEFICSNCKFVFRKQDICPKCGTPLSHYAEDVETARGKLVGLPKTKKPKKKEVSVEERQKWYSMFLLQAAEKGHKEGWAFWKYKDKFKEKPPNSFHRGLEKPTEEFKKYITYLNIKASYRKQT